jgi:hypothetical protein
MLMHSAVIEPLASARLLLRTSLIQMRSLGNTRIQEAHVELLFSQVGLHTAWLLTLPIYMPSPVRSR